MSEAGAFPIATRAMQLWSRNPNAGLVHGRDAQLQPVAVAIIPPDSRSCAPRTIPVKTRRAQVTQRNPADPKI